MELNKEMRTWIETWDESLTYYMEKENIPENRVDRDIYYRQAREFLSDRLTDLWRMLRNYSTDADRAVDVCKA